MVMMIVRDSRVVVPVCVLGTNTTGTTTAEQCRGIGIDLKRLLPTTRECVCVCVCGCKSLCLPD